jgi:hypothetical protein
MSEKVLEDRLEEQQGIQVRNGRGTRCLQEEDEPKFTFSD